MTDRTELQILASKVGAAIALDSAGRLSRVTWNGRTYGAGSLYSLLDFAEKARG